MGARTRQPRPRPGAGKRPHPRPLAKMRRGTELHATTTHLLWGEGERFTAEEKPEVTEDTIATGIRAAVLENPGASWSNIRGARHRQHNRGANVRDSLLARGEIRNTVTEKGYFNLILQPKTRP